MAIVANRYEAGRSIYGWSAAEAEEAIEDYREKFYPSSEPIGARCQPPNKRLERTVMRDRGGVASAPFHYALGPRVTRHRAAAQPQRSASERG